MKTGICRAVALAGVMLAAVAASGAENPASTATSGWDDAAVGAVLQKYKAALVIRELPGGKMYRFHPELCSQPQSPYSTFKIANALCALENGVVTDENSMIRWDGTERDNPAWNKDLTLKQAMGYSAVPHFQQLASMAGEATMQTFLNRINYGNHDISGGLTNFWLGSSLKISADEQVDFLTRMVQGKLQVTPHSRQVVTAIMFQKETPKGRLYGKTGTARQGKLGWFVGWADLNDGNTYVFALWISQGPNTTGLTAKNLIGEIFAQRHLL